MSLEAAKIWEDSSETALTALRNTYFKPFYLPTLQQKEWNWAWRALAQGLPTWRLPAWRTFALLCWTRNQHKMPWHPISLFPLGWTVSQGLSMWYTWLRNIVHTFHNLIFHIVIVINSRVLHFATDISKVTNIRISPTINFMASFTSSYMYPSINLHGWLHYRLFLLTPF